MSEHIPRKRTEQKQSARINLRKKDHREVILNDIYHNAIYIGQDGFPSWRKYKHKKIITEAFDRLLSIDCDNEVVHIAEDSRDCGYGFYRTQDYIYNFYEYSSGSTNRRIYVSANGSDFKRIAMPSGNFNQGIRNTKRCADNQLIECSTSGFRIARFVMDDDTKMVKSLDVIATITFNETFNGKRPATMEYLCHTTHGALVMASFSGEVYYPIYEVTTNGYTEKGFYPFRPYGRDGTENYSFYEAEATHLMLHYVKTKVGDKFVHTYTLHASQDLNSYQTFLLGGVGEEGADYTETHFQIISTEEGAYIYCIIPLYSDRYGLQNWKMRVFKYSNGNVEEITIPKFVDIKMLDSTNGKVCADTGYTHRRIFTSWLAEDNHEAPPEYDVQSAYDLCFGPVGSYPMLAQSGSLGLIVEDGVLPAFRQPFWLSQIRANGTRIFYYIDNMTFTVSDNNFSFNYGTGNDGAEHINKDDYVFKGGNHG